MGAVIIRNLSDETRRALKSRALAKGHSTEAEMRAILEEAVFPKKRILLGDELAELGRRLGGIDLSFERDKTPATGASFE